MNPALHLVCPHCSAVNRLQSQRLADQPKCGQCHQPLFTGHPLTLTAASFGLHLDRSEIPILVDFWAPWCGPCKMVAPEFERAAQALEPVVRLAKVNTEAEPQLGNRYGIRSIPTLVLFRAGREIARQPGAMVAADIVRWTQQRIA